ncbi:uncharacterized protein At1g08160 [Ricinus communis]|uniref:Late embryogenesis abundant protein LEA-2 subgroup domain-containing protein n=1 Tax=Ricinus communis TaxID=3988 RepID=B9SCM0_RICCO|nr:uncharacterized protein At1g08160 [Ricinus communis]EEF38679.1 conserved hypothetical protein [Ricinus communis]|eukprot:XP_002523739.1 uncharacterized protein At1g08160 [Ricinus communis]
MANSTATTTQQPPRPAHSKLFRVIAVLILTLIVIVGLVVLITWLIIRPKSMEYSIENGSVHNLNLNSNNNHLNASFDFVIRAYNPNTRISIYYDYIDVSLSYDDQTLAFNTLEPFHQPRRNVTRLEAKIEARDAALSQALSKDMRIEKASGQLQLDLRLKARIRFKVGVMKFKHRHLSVICPAVMVHFSSSKIAQRSYCDIEY